ncbi:MAG: oligosaccharide flippase family protein [Prevotella sp.]
MSKNSYSHILKYTGLFGGIQFLNILIALIRNKFVALILGPQGMGLISIYNSTTNLMSNSTNLGIPMSGIKNISESFEQGDTEKINQSVKLIRSWSMLTALLGMFACILLSPVLNDVTFSWGEHTLHFVCLSPIIALTAITSGEIAILKGTRHLGKLAKISVYNIIGALITSVPIYYFFRDAGIIPSLIIIAGIQMLLTIHMSYRLYPPAVSLSRNHLNTGCDMVKLGIAFVFAGILGSGADFAIRSFLNNASSLDTVGLFNAGYMMTMTYAGMVFSAMETDFFPRLSAVNGEITKSNTIVNNQIEVSLLLIAPMLVTFIIGLPVILPLLYSKSFMPVSDMMKITIIAMYFRVIKLPIAYTTLARGDSGAYLLLEGLYDIIVVILTVIGFTHMGLVGAGLAMTITTIIDLCIVIGFTHYKYKYVISTSVIKYLSLQLPVGLMAFAASFIVNALVYWLIGGALVLISTLISIRILQSKVSLWNKLVSRFTIRKQQ